MPIFLVTGAPGSGKTLSTIEKVDKRSKEENRPVYYSNIKEVTLENWHHIENIESWYDDIPSNSLIFIDEFYLDFPKIGTKKPEYYNNLAIHRHRGFDIFFVCQGTQQIDLFIKDLIGSHEHFKRSEMLNKSKVFKSTEIIDNPHKKSSRKDLETYTYLFNKKYFGTYKSADEHTFKKRLPKSYVYFFLSVFILFFISYFLKTSFESKFKNEEINQSKDTYLSSIADKVDSDNFKNNSFDDKDIEFFFTPKVKNMPETAPIYESLINQVKQFPRLQCILSEKKGCVCYTQQATRVVDYPFDKCLKNVRIGIYYPQQEDFAFNRKEQRKERREERVSSDFSED